MGTTGKTAHESSASVPTLETRIGSVRLESTETVEWFLEARTNDDGLFVDNEGRLVLEDPVPLARLHVAAALRGEDRSVLPTPVGDRRSPEGGV